MAWIKICAKGHRNERGAMVCAQPGCEDDLSGVMPVEEPEPQVEAGSGPPAVPAPTPAQAPGPAPASHVPTKPEAIIRLLTEDGREIMAQNGDKIGRNAIGTEYLQNFPTVGREHIQVFSQNEAWRLKNISQTNPTFLNGQEVPRGEEREIKPGDELKLSTKCRLLIVL